MMEAVHTSETSVDNHFTRQYIPEDNSEHHTRLREDLKSHEVHMLFQKELIPWKVVHQKNIGLYLTEILYGTFFGLVANKEMREK
jgi:hypothetical protein